MVAFTVTAGRFLFSQGQWDDGVLSYQLSAYRVNPIYLFVANLPLVGAAIVVGPCY